MGEEPHCNDGKAFTCYAKKQKQNRSKEAAIIVVFGRTDGRGGGDTSTVLLYLFTLTFYQDTYPEYKGRTGK